MVCFFKKKQQEKMAIKINNFARFDRRKKDEE